MLRRNGGSIDKKFVECKQESVKGLGVLVLGTDVREEGVDLRSKVPLRICGRVARVSCAPET